MDTSKIIRGIVNGRNYTVTSPIVKEDYGLYLKIEGVELPSTYEVDFSNSESSGTSVTMIGNADGVLIPRQFIDSGKDVFAFLYHVGEDFGKTVYKFRIPNKLRPDRTNEQPTPEEQSVIDQTISALNEAVSDAQDAQQAAQAIEDMTVSAHTLSAGSEATVTKTEIGGVVNLDIGIPKGEAGITPDLSIGTVQTLPAGSQATAEITGTEEEPVLNLGLPKGDAGDVSDVQIDGVSVVSGGVANVPIATSNSKGVVKGHSSYGVGVYSDGTLYLKSTSTDMIKNGVNNAYAITPAIQSSSTFYGLAKAAGADEKNSTLAIGQYTENAKSAIHDMLNAPVEVSGTTPTITAKSGIQYICGEVATLDITLPDSGIVDVVFTSGSTATVLTVTPPTGQTVRWANGFDATSLEANTVYEINILNGLGVVQTWSTS